MASITELEQELAQATCHIVEARARIARQFGIVRGLEAAGHDTARAKSPYREIEDGFEAVLAHRERIIRDLSAALGEDAG
jgi:hypothetical protein